MANRIAVTEAEPKDARFIARLEIVGMGQVEPGVVDEKYKYWAQRLEVGPGPIYIAAFEQIMRIGYLALNVPEADKWTANYYVLPRYEQHDVLDLLLAKAHVVRDELPLPTGHEPRQEVSV